MKIGMDIDDTTVVMVKPMLKYAEIFDTQVLGRKGSNGNFGLIHDFHYLKALYGWDEETKFAFFNQYYKNVLEECSPMEHAVNVLQQLKQEGNQLFFITARLKRNSTLRYRNNYAKYAL